MKRYYLLILVIVGIFLSLSCHTPQRINSKYTTYTLTNHSFIAKKYDAKIFYYLNKLRKNPAQFYTQYVEDYVNENKDRLSKRYTVSLRKTLKSIPHLPPFKISKTLQPATKKQLHYLTYQLKGKRLTHLQGKTNFKDRFKHINLKEYAENLYRATHSSPLELVLDLLIDEGVPSLGHRKNMLNPDYNLVNIQSAKASNNMIVTVMDFGKK